MRTENIPVKWNLLAATIKWEAVRWLMSVGGWVAALLVCWGLLLVIPIPAEDSQEFLRTVLTFGISLLLPAPVFAAVYMMIFYPLISTSWSLRKIDPVSHMSGRPYAYKLYTRLAFNLVTYLMGIGVIPVTLVVLRRWEDMGVGRVWAAINNDASPILRVLFEQMFAFALSIPLILLLVAYAFDGIYSKRGWWNEHGFSIVDYLGAFFAFFAVYLASGHFADWLFSRINADGGSFIMAQTVRGVIIMTAMIFAASFMARFIDKHGEASI